MSGERGKYDSLMSKYGRGENKHKVEPYTLWRMTIPYAPADSIGEAKERFVIILDSNYELSDLDDDPDAPMDSYPYFAWFTHTRAAYDKCCNIQRNDSLSDSDKIRNGLGNVFVHEDMVPKFGISSPSVIDFIGSSRSFDVNLLSAAHFEMRGTFLGRLPMYVIRWLYGFRDIVAGVTGIEILPPGLVEGIRRSNDEWRASNRPAGVAEGAVRALEANGGASSEDIADFIESLYDLRRKSIAEEGEYGIGNLVFKEFRNRGYLDVLKTLRDELKSSELSLECVGSMRQSPLSEGSTSGKPMSDRRLIGYVGDCIDFLNSHGYGIDKSDIGLFSFSGTKSSGVMRPPAYEGGKFMLGLNDSLSDGSEDEVKATIYHELCHYLQFREIIDSGIAEWKGGRLKMKSAAGRKYSSHGDLWKSYADAVGKLAGIKITPYFAWDEKPTMYDAAYAQAKYAIKCAHCGAMFLYPRSTKFVKDVIAGNGHSEWVHRCPDGFKSRDYEIVKSPNAKPAPQRESRSAVAKLNATDLCSERKPRWENQ